MSKSVNTTPNAQTRVISINGTPGAKFEFFVKQGTTFYNFNSNLFQTNEFLLKNQEIDSSGTFSTKVDLPTVTTTTSYDIFVRPIGEVDIEIQRTASLKAGIITQVVANNAITFNTVEGSGSTFTIASSLSGNKLNKINEPLNFNGEITNAGGGSLFTYVNKVPTILDFSNIGTTITATVQAVNQTGTATELTFERPDAFENITVGLDVTFTDVVNEGTVTVASITGDESTLAASSFCVVVLSTVVANVGPTAIFTASGYDGVVVNTNVSGSGTTSTSLSVTAELTKIGDANVTSQLDVDDFMTDTPNAFPITINVPIDTATQFNVGEVCTNFLGTLGDIDSNASTKTYKVHSLPSHTTSSVGVSGASDTFGTITQANGDAISAGDTLTGGEVIYTPGPDMEPLSTDSFVYKCTDAQSSPKNSSTTQGLVSITIVG